MTTFYQPKQQHFESAGDYIEWLKTTPAAPNYGQTSQDAFDRPNGASSDERRKPEKDWDYNAGVKGAMDLAENGWTEGLNKIKNVLDLNSNPIGETPRRINDVAGDLPDIGRYLAGQPDCMTRRIINQGHRRPIVDLELSVTYNWSIKSANIINLGAAFVSMIDELENAGYRAAVTVIYYSNMRNGAGKVGSSVQIKHPDQAINLSDLIFFIAHPAAYRRLAFMYFENVLSRDEMGEGYGTPSQKEYTPEMLEANPNLIYFNKFEQLVSGCTTYDKAIKHVKDTIKKQRPELLNEYEQQEAA